MAKEFERFDIQIVHDKFEAALHEEDDVHLQFYLESFEELNKFFTLMGSVFGFVSEDLKAKMDMLNNFLKDSEMSDNFVTVKKMIEYEKQNNLLDKKDYISGSRTLLRLHRGLDFIKLFLKKLGELRDHDSTSAACRDAYKETLARHHTFFIRNGAKIAIYALPTREVLLKRVCGELEHIQRAMDMLPKTLETTSLVYNRIENLYTVNDLHTLP